MADPSRPASYEELCALPANRACEVLSPRSAPLDRGDKRKVYGEFGVKHLWYVDPEAQTLEIFVLEENGYRVVDVFSGAAHVRAEPFDAIVLELGALWAR